MRYHWLINSVEWKPEFARWWLHTHTHQTICHCCRIYMLSITTERGTEQMRVRARVCNRTKPPRLGARLCWRSAKSRLLLCLQVVLHLRLGSAGCVATFSIQKGVCRRHTANDQHLNRHKTHSAQPTDGKCVNWMRERDGRLRHTHQTACFS